jgi:nitrate reductase NapE component
MPAIHLRRWGNNAAALAAAALVATTVTSLIVTTVASLGDLVWILEMRDADPKLRSILGFDFQRSLGEWPSRLLLGLVLGPLLAILFGFVGAFVFLAAGFSLVSSRRHERRTYGWTGALVGLAHSGVGLLLSRADTIIGPTSSWENVIQSIAGWGGFFLTSSPRLEVVVATFPASSIAGALAGLAYARLAPRSDPAATA